MSRRVMIVDSDVDALGTLASALRARGLAVYIASEVYDAVEQAYVKSPHVLLVAKELDREGDLSAALAAVTELSELPLLYLTSASSAAALGPREVRRGDVDHIASRILEVAARENAPEVQQELRGNVQQMPLVDLLQLLTMNQRSGVLAVTTASGTGEVRLANGHVVDAVYRRVEGEKALFRLLGEHQGQFMFMPGEGAVRRIATPTNALLMEAMRQMDEMRELRKIIAPAAEVFVADEALSPISARKDPDSGDQLEREIVTALQVPRSLDELCDEVTAPDLHVVRALARLMDAGQIHAAPLASLTTPFAPVEQLSVLRALVSRLTPQGFLPPPRIVIVASHRRMVGLAHAVRYIEGVTPPSDVPPRAALPRPLGTLRLGEGVDLVVVGLPPEDTFAPLWALVLPGAAAVVRIDGAGGDAFEVCCEAAEAKVLEAERLVTELDVAVPAQVAALLRSALEAAAGV
jgi:ActR/RegA family two-component response regulator